MLTIPVREGNRPARFHQLIASVPLPEAEDDLPHCLEGRILTFAGDPAGNENTNLLLQRLAPTGVRPVIRTRLPKNRDIGIYLNCVINLLNESYDGSKGVLKLDIGSTSEKTRHLRYGDVFSLTELSKLFGHLPRLKSGKVVLILQASMPLDPGKLTRLFPPDIFAVELLPDKEGLRFPSGEMEEALRKEGFDLAYEETEDDS